MALYDSESGKEAGEKSTRKGVPNKSTKEIRDAFQCFVEDNLEKLQGMFDEIKRPQDKLAFIKELSEYILPKLSRTEIKAEITTDDVDLSKLPQEMIDKLLNSEDNEDEATG